MAPVQIKLDKFRFRQKMAAFDFDWTLVKPKSSGTFPTTVDDWQWLRPSVPTTLQTLYKKSYCIIIFTNQSKDWKQTQIVNALQLREE